MLLLPLIWVGGDFVYARVVARRAEKWEASIQRGADGIRAGCEAFDAGDGDRALLLVHGFGDSPAIFRTMAPALAGRGFACRAMRLPGAAEPLRTAARVKHGDWVRAIGDELAALRAKHRDVWVVGHSLGGTLAAECLAANPGAADGLVLIAPLIRVSGRRSPVLPAKTWFLVCDNLLFFTRVVEDYLPLDARSEEARAYRFDDHFFPSETYREMFRAVALVRDCPPRLRGPLLMILAPDDQVTDIRASERFFDQCASAPKERVRIQPSGHVIPIDFGWSNATDAIVRFVDGASGRRVR